MERRTAHMEWFAGRILGRSNREEASVFVKSRSAARPVLTETPQPVTRIERQGRRTTKEEERFSGFGSPPGKF
jgi:hypothetical protein